MSGNLVRGFAVASATAVTTVGAVAGVGQSGTGQAVADAGTTASGSTLLADIPMEGQARIQTASLNQQADAQSVAADTSARQTAAEAARVQAAKDAIAKQQEAQRKEAQQKEAKRKEAERKALRDAEDGQEEQQQAGGSSTESSGVTQQSSYSVADVQAIARQIVPGGQFTCFSNIVDHESDWNYKAVNPSSGAYGLVQAYPGSKMSSAGADWRTNPATQIKWGLNYMNERYGSPCDAWAFWQANGSY
ncbi:transglycosylase SLT domain-containing protein [Streptomyces deccanensis]|uniref:aggregation-promoting factor C-terminal-like domain-containing protein n=1 Tax=Streptomyces deccanensis TaxID=424188 RepID=UPI001EFB4D32|nr:transglycosylase SLT domain-containing protein [Streptomyces deccanensis]ULR52211.1 transglycosylase SLT domain-containing protein [Streptomyces deccanensis]